MVEKETEIEEKNEEGSNIENETSVVLEHVEEINDDIDENLAEEIEVEKDAKETTFIKEILVGAVDQIVSIVSALVILIVFNLILKIFGYYIAEKEPMFLIMYVLVNIIYAPLCKKSKFKSTVGKKLLLNK